MTDRFNVFADEWADPYPQPDGWRANWKLAMAHSESQRGQPLWTVHRLDDAADYFDGETPAG